MKICARALACAMLVTTVALLPAMALADASAAREEEYIEIRWDGLDKMVVILPDGQVSFIGNELKGIGRPDDVDKRAFYMALAMNRMAAKGYVFAGMIQDEIVMKRPVAH